MLPVCAGVFAAHEQGVIHRDLKPQNIFLARTALGDVVPKVLDFGISKLIDEQGSTRADQLGLGDGDDPLPVARAGRPASRSTRAATSSRWA